MVFLFGFSAVEHKNPLLQLKQSGVGIGVGRVKRRYKRKNAVSPVKKGPSPVKRHLMMASPAKTLPPPMKSREPMNVVKVSILTVSYMKLKVFFVWWQLIRLPTHGCFSFPRLNMDPPHQPQNRTSQSPNPFLARLQRWLAPMTWRTLKHSYGSGSPPWQVHRERTCSLTAPAHAGTYVVCMAAKMHFYHFYLFVRPHGGGHPAGGEILHWTDWR